MAEAPYPVKRANPRFSFFADAEVTLRDGTGVRGQLAELSSRGCCIDTLEPIPIRTRLRLRICDGTNTCELHGKVIYVQSGGGFGIFGMGVLFEEMGAEQHSAIGAWLRKLAGRPGKDLGKTRSLKSKAKSHRIDAALRLALDPECRVIGLISSEVRDDDPLALADKWFQFRGIFCLNRR